MSRPGIACGDTWDDGKIIRTGPDEVAVVLGTFSGDVVYGDGEPGATAMTSDGARGAFLAAYNPGGALRWARPLPGGDETTGSGRLVVLSDGSAALAATFRGTQGFFLGEPGGQSFASAGQRDLFVTRVGW